MRTGLPITPLFVGSTAIFTFVFPKAGLYVGDTPLLVGHIALTLTFLFVLARRWSIHRGVALAAALLTILGTLSSLMIMFIGTLPTTSASVAPVLLSLWILPVFSVVVFGAFVQRYWVFTAKIMALGLLGVMVYTLVSFVSTNLFGQILAVPYLTVTGGDVDVLLGKHSDRGGIFKAYGTYNNGNVLGVSLLIWAPLALHLLRRRVNSNLLRLVLIVTLSRTVWIGMIAYEVLGAVKQRRLWPMLRLLVGVPLLVVAIYLTARNFLGWAPERLLDSNLGGRADQLSFDFTILPGVFRGMQEIVYLSILRSFGVVGLLAFIAVWFWPLLLRRRYVPAQMAQIGMLLYVICMVSDGAFVLPPVTVLYWAMAAVVIVNPRDLPTVTPSGSIRRQSGQLR